MEPTRINNRSSQSLNVEEILKLISLQIATVEAEVKTLRIRSDGHQQAIEKHQKAIEDQQTEIKNMIRVPCPAKGCTKTFRTKSHRNRHIRNTVQKERTREPLWQEHEYVREELKLALKEGTVSEHGSDREEDMLQNDPTLRDDPAILPATMEVRTALPFSGSTSTFPAFELHQDSYMYPNLRGRIQELLRAVGTPFSPSDNPKVPGSELESLDQDMDLTSLIFNPDQAFQVPYEVQETTDLDLSTFMSQLVEESGGDQAGA